MKPTNVPNMRRHVPFGINPTKKYSVWDYKFSVLFFKREPCKKNEPSALIPVMKKHFFH
jgi:hypothetical protein